jgi:hypothetical protein
VNDLVTLLTLTYELLFSSSLAGGAVTDTGGCCGIWLRMAVTPRQLRFREAKPAWRDLALARTTYAGLSHAAGSRVAALRASRLPWL